MSSLFINAFAAACLCVASEAAPNNQWGVRHQNTGNPYRRGTLSTVDLLVLSGLDQLILIIETLLFYKTSYFKKEVNCIANREGGNMHYKEGHCMY
jgi:hypothetical protein